VQVGWQRRLAPRNNYIDLERFAVHAADSLRAAGCRSLQQSIKVNGGNRAIASD
jgi:hypothetical protein